MGLDYWKEMAYFVKVIDRKRCMARKGLHFSSINYRKDDLEEGGKSQRSRVESDKAKVGLAWKGCNHVRDSMRKDGSRLRVMASPCME